MICYLIIKTFSVLAHSFQTKEIATFPLKVPFCSNNIQKSDVSCFCNIDGDIETLS